MFKRLVLQSLGIGLGILLLAMLTMVSGLSGLETTAAHADDVKEADIVVQLGDQNVVLRQITFTDSISGLSALELTNLDVVTAEFSFGTAICAIEGLGCPAENCFCGSDSWTNSRWDGSQWQPYPVGAADTVISQTGSIEGWRWGKFGALPAPPQEAQAGADALAWLRSLQRADGGYGDPGSTADVMLAIGANRIDGSDWTASSSSSILDYWSQDDVPDDEHTNNAAAYAAQSPAAAAKLLLAVRAAGADPTAFAGLDLSAIVNGNYDAATGAYGFSNWDQALSMLAVAAGEDPVPSAAADLLAARANPDGSWGFMSPRDAGDTNSTALALQAIRAAGACRRAPVVEDAVVFLKQAQNDDGGFNYTTDDQSDANSTAFAIQGLIAADREPADAYWAQDGVTPVDFLLSLQIDGGAAAGSFAYQAGGAADALATQQAVPALLRTPFVNEDDLTTCYETYLPLVRSSVQ